MDHLAARLAQETLTRFPEAVSRVLLAGGGAGHLVKAVRLYATLCRGDLSLLEEYFPGLAVALGSRPNLPRRSVFPAVTYLPRPDDDVLSEALDNLGLDDLDFSN